MRLVETTIRFSAGTLEKLRFLAHVRSLEAGRTVTWNALVRDLVETHLLGGLSRHDAQLYLSRRTIGPSPWAPETPLQTAILDACAADIGRSVA